MLDDAFREQHGVCTRRQAHAEGATKRQIATRIRKGSVEALGRKVLRATGAPRTDEQRVLIAVLDVASDSIAGTETALAVWGVPGFEVPDRPDVLRARHGTERSVYGTVHETKVLPAEHRTTRNGIPIATPARALADACATAHPLKMARAMDHCLHKKLVTTDQLVACVRVWCEQGRPGTRVFRRLVARRLKGYVPTESAAEADFVDIVEKFALPVPERQVSLGDAEHFIGRVDFLFRTARLIVEIDGGQHRTVSQIEDDERRDAALKVAGWRILRIPWDLLIRDPAKVAALVNAELAAAAAA